MPPVLIPPRVHADVVIDSARNHAARPGLAWISTGGILLDAHRERLLRKVSPVLDRMQARGFDVWSYEDILKAAGEIT